MVRDVGRRLGRVDVLVNNVGWTMDRLFVEKMRAEWEKEIQLNLWGTITAEEQWPGGTEEDQSCPTTSSIARSARRKSP